MDAEIRIARWKLIDDGYKMIDQQITKDTRGKFGFDGVQEVWENKNSRKVCIFYKDNFEVLDEEIPDSIHYGCRRDEE